MGKELKIVFVWPAASYSIYDVARGYHGALKRQGHEMVDFRLYRRLDWMINAFASNGWSPRIHEMSKMASESLVCQVIREKPNLVLVMSGIAMHPDALWMIKEIFPRLPIVTILTESPYYDKEQEAFAQLSDVVFTTERASAEKYGWLYIQHACDPTIHHPVEVDPSKVSDVMMVGTGFEDRQEFLDQVDWAECDFRLLGQWPKIQDDEHHPLYRYVTPSILSNEGAVAWYSSTDIGLNLHRWTDGAYSINPRTFELAACGTFQLCSYRPELEAVFQGSVIPFSSPGDLSALLKEWTGSNREEARREKAMQARELVKGHTFDNRADQLMTRFLQAEANQ
tara:strand:- start:2218 stop:3234 length:1017 start_codon:yes stop_codon:yes gene_type:complete